MREKVSHSERRRRAAWDSAKSEGPNGCTALGLSDVTMQTSPLRRTKTQLDSVPPCSYCPA